MTQVLVVDDDSDVRDLVAQWLRGDGHDVLAAANGTAALAAVDRYGSPQLAVLEIAMPDTDGVELLHRLRERTPGLPVLVLTVLWSARDVQRIHAAGGLYMPKPFTGRALRTAVRAMLAGGAA